jgi:hypothetical protein
MKRLLFLTILLTSALLAGPLPGPVPDDLVIDYNNLLWAWASPCAGGCSMPLPTYQEGWRYASEVEWASRPAPEDFLRPDGSVRCASAYFDPIFTHCDLDDALGGYVTSYPTGDNYESWFVKDIEGGAIPEPSALWLAGSGLLAALLAKRRR